MFSEQQASEGFLNWKYESHYRGKRKISHEFGQDFVLLNSEELDDSRFFITIKVKPLQNYLASVNCIGNQIITQHKGGTGANICIMGTWNHSYDFDEGVGDFQGQLNLAFTSPSDGKVTIGLRLGYWSSEAQGTAYFSQFSLKEIPPVHIYFHKPLFLEDFVPEFIFSTFLDRLNLCYEEMTKLYGKTPFNNEIIQIILKNHNAWAYSGNPIVWNPPCCLDFFRDLVYKCDNGCFGIIHEMGHDFDMTIIGKINHEFAANFSLCYAVEKLNLPIYFDNELTYGKGLQEGFYKRAYENTINKGKYHHDGLMYCILKIKDQIGWEPFEKTMRYFISNNIDAKCKIDAFLTWMESLSSFSSKDVFQLFDPKDLDFLLLTFAEKEINNNE